MAHYRAYIVGRDDQFTDRIDLDCVDDNAAIEAAKHHTLAGLAVEVWQASRKVTRLEPASSIETRRK